MRCAWAVLLLVALLCVCSGTEARTSKALPDADLLRALHLHEHDLTLQAMLTYDGVATAEHAPRLSLPQGDSACCDCVSSVGHHVLKSAVEAANAACKNVTCPFLKDKCDWLADHQAELAGYLAVKVRAYSSAFFWCMGNATCEHPSDSQASSDMSAALLSADVASHPAFEHAQIMAATPFVQQALTTKLDDATNDGHADKHARVATFSRRMAEDESRNVTDKQCHKCLHNGVEWVMHRSIKQIKKACKATKCPKLQQFCKWAKEHKHFVRGMVYASVEPPKYAIGWCAGRDECQHPHSTAGSMQQTAWNMPMSMGGDEHRQEHRHHADKPYAPIIGGGSHDRVPHGQRKPSYTQRAEERLHQLEKMAEEKMRSVTSLFNKRH